MPEHLEVSFPLLTLNYEKYYGLNYDARSIELVFNKAILEESISGNIILSDKNGYLASGYDLLLEGKIIFIRFHNDFYLNGGWKYPMLLMMKIIWACKD